MRKKLMLILNPNAGKRGGVMSTGSILKILCKGGYTPTVFYTEGPRAATELVLQHGMQYDCITCVGGDGTLSETVAGLVQLANPPVLGYIPLGTANDVATTLKLPKNSSKATKRILQGKPVPLDVGKFNETEYFTYIAAFGAFTDVSYETTHEQKQNLGHLAYVLQGMAQLSKIQHFKTKVEYDGGFVEGDYIFGSVSNSKSVAGMVKLSDDDVSLDDGEFEVILVKNPANVIEMNQIIANVLARNFNTNKISIFHSKKVKFTFEKPAKWTRDGETGGVHQHVQIENIYRPIQIIV